MPLPFSDFQPLLERFAGRFFVLVECVGVDVQGGGWLRVAQQAGYPNTFGKATVFLRIADILRKQQSH